MRPVLVWESARGAVEFPLADTAIVGREEDADVQVQEPLVSRLHARIERRGEAWFLIDLGSTNLTRVNGSVIREKELFPGDEVQFARARCRFVEVDSRVTAPPTPEAPSDAALAESTDADTPRPTPVPSGRDVP